MWWWKVREVFLEAEEIRGGSRCALPHRPPGLPRASEHEKGFSAICLRLARERRWAHGRRTFPTVGDFGVATKTNYKLLLEYDGSGYHGWQRQRGVLTIQEVVETRMAIMTCEPVALIGAGRTDAGVHARGQVANFLSATPISPRRLLEGLNSLLPDDIVALDLIPVAGDFHARYRARSKLYEYRIHNSSRFLALGRQYVWHISQPLRWDLMEICLRSLEGRHDFSSFQAAGSGVRSAERTVLSTAILCLADEVWSIRIQADGFLRHMVRTVVGTLVEVGRGKVAEEEFAAILTARDRRRAGMTAPARGLCLLDVAY
jgi:tRNA pseudouridine38-40 synthase